MDAPLFPYPAGKLNISDSHFIPPQPAWNNLCNGIISEKE
jgi:hypothetical protein